MYIFMGVRRQTKLMTILRAITTDTWLVKVLVIQWDQQKKNHQWNVISSCYRDLDDRWWTIYPPPWQNRGLPLPPPVALVMGWSETPTLRSSGDRFRNKFDVCLWYVVARQSRQRRCGIRPSRVASRRPHFGGASLYHQEACGRLCAPRSCSTSMISSSSDLFQSCCAAERTTWLAS